MMPARAKKPTERLSPRRKSASPDHVTLRLYVAGQTPKSVAALENLKRVCDEHLSGMYKLEIIDLVKNPKLARDDQIVAIPTVVKKVPAPLRKLIGDLSNTERVLVGLDIRKVGDK